MKDPDSPSETDRRWVLRRVFVAACFGWAWAALTSGAVLTRFGKQVGLSDFGFGLLVSISYIAAAAQIPASLFMERHGHRKSMIVWCALIHRAFWLVVALIPWILPAGALPYGLVTLLGLSAITGQATMPAWISWTADIVPARIRGRYVSRRNQVGQLIGLVMTIGAGLAMDWAEAASGVALGRMLSVLLAGGAILGIVDILLVSTVPDRATLPRNANMDLKELLMHPLQDRSFRYFILFTATLTFSTGFVGQFTWLYVFDVLKVSNTRANLLLVIGPVLAMLVGLPFWGRMIDRLGRKPVMIVAVLGFVPGAAAWILVSREHIFPGYLLVLFCAFVQAGIDLANYNIMLGLVERRTGIGLNSGYVAVNSLVGAVVGALSGLFGGAVAKGLTGWHGAFLGLTLTYHGVLFLLAGGFRLMALFWLRMIDDPRSFAARDAIRYMVADVYSTIQGALTMPVRVGRRMTYKLAALRRFGNKR